MTFHGLAEHILKQVDKPLTANEIWQLAIDQGLAEKAYRKQAQLFFAQSLTDHK